MCFGSKAKPGPYTYESPARPSSPSRVEQTTEQRASAPLVLSNAGTTVPAQSLATEPAASRTPIESNPSSSPSDAMDETLATRPPDVPPSLGHVQSAYEQTTQAISPQHMSPNERRPTIPDLPIPVSRHPTEDNLPIPVYHRAPNTNDLPIPVHAPDPTADESLPIPVITPSTDRPPLASPTSSAGISTTSANSASQKKIKTHWNPFTTPKHKDPSTFKTDSHNPHLHSKPAVSALSSTTLNSYDAEQAYTAGFRDAHNGLPDHTPWGLAGEHYSRGYRAAAEAKINSGGGYRGLQPRDSQSQPTVRGTNLAPVNVRQISQTSIPHPDPPMQQSMGGAQELGAGLAQPQQRPGHGSPRVDVTGQVELPSNPQPQLLPIQPGTGPALNPSPNAGYRDASIASHLDEASRMLHHGGTSWRRSSPSPRQ